MPDTTLENDFNDFRRHFIIKVNQLVSLYFNDLKTSIIKDIRYAESKVGKNNLKYTFADIELTILFGKGDEQNWKDKDFLLKLESIGENLIDYLQCYDGMTIQSTKKGS